MIYGNVYNTSDALKAVKDTVELTEEDKTAIQEFSKLGSGDLKKKKEILEKSLGFDIKIPKYQEPKPKKEK